MLRKRLAFVWLVVALAASALWAQQEDDYGDGTGPAPAHFAAPPPADQAARQLRELRGAKWNQPGKPQLVLHQGPGGVRIFVTRILAPPVLPVDDSHAVIVGRVLNAHSYLSPDRTAAYTEFSVKATQVLKAPAGRPIPVNATIVTQRVGGMILYPGGFRREYGREDDVHRPRAGATYVFFLNHDAPSDTWTDKLCFQVQGPRVRVIEDLTGTYRRKYDRYLLTAFLQEIRAAVEGE